MITSKLLQAAESALNQVDEIYTEDEVNDAIAFLGVGPRAFAHKLDRDVLKPFLLGVLAERLAMAVNFGMIEDPEALTLVTSDDEPYEDAAKQDIQDILQMAYECDTEDDVSMESLMEMLIEQVATRDQDSDPETRSELSKALVG